MRRSLPVLWLGLILAGCEKPAPAGETGEASANNERRERRLRAPASPTPREILESADKLDAPEAREKAIAAVAWDAIETDPELAHEAFLKLPPDSPERMRLIQHYAMVLAGQDAGEAFVWANNLASENEAGAAYARIALVMAETDPRRAAELLSETAIPGRDLDVAVVEVTQRWAAQSPPDAAAWITDFPPGAAREAGIKAVSERWLAVDAKSAFVWLGGIEDAEIRAGAARAMQGALLQQTREIRDSWLQHADAGMLGELEQQHAGALKDVGDNVLPEAN